MKCPNGHEVADGSRFCNICGAPIPQHTVCPNGHVNPEGSRFCNVCGSSIGAPAPVPQPTPTPQDVQPNPMPAPAKKPASNKWLKILLWIVLIFAEYHLIYGALSLATIRVEYHCSSPEEIAYYEGYYYWANTFVDDGMFNIFHATSDTWSPKTSKETLITIAKNRYYRDVWICIGVSAVLAAAASIGLALLKRKEKKNKQLT